MARNDRGQFEPGTSGNPDGAQRKLSQYESALLDIHVDGWTSALTGLGTTTRDKRMSHTFAGSCLTYMEVARLWEKDGLACKAIESPSAEAFREGYELTIGTQGKYDDLKEDVEDRLETLCADDAIEKAWQYKRAYGGATILLGTDDDAPLDEPLVDERVRSLDYLTVFEPLEMIPEDPSGDLQSYGQAQYYRINNTSSMLYAGSNYNDKLKANRPKINSRIHRSRLIVLDGIQTSRYLQSGNQVSPLYGASVVDRFIEALRDVSVAFAGCGILATDVSQPIIQIQGLLQMVGKNEEKLRARMAAIEMSRSNARAILLDEKEKFDRQTTNLSGIPELLDRLSIRLAAEIDIPLSVLLGYSPSSLGQPGEVELKLWYNKIRSMQRRKLSPLLKRIARLTMRSLRQRKLPKRFDIEWFELERLNEKDRAEARLNQARADEIYLKYGALSPDEVRKARWTGRYSFETQIDTDAKAPGYVAVAPKGVAGVAGAPAGGGGGGGAAAAGSHVVGGYARRDPVKRDEDGDGNHVMFADMQVCIESPMGSKREWIDTDGTAGSTTMKYDYGYIVGTWGTDGDSVDVYLGPTPHAQWVYVVHQQSKASGFTQYDEDKVMLGFDSPNHARDAYLRQYDDERFFGGMTVMDLDQFRLKLFSEPGEKVAA